MVSVVIPVLEEESGVGRCLQAALQAVGSEDEVILVDGGLSGASSRLVGYREDWADVVKAVRYTGRRVLWNLLRCGVEHAAGKYVVFSDIDEWIEAGSVEHIERLADSLEVDAVQARKIKRIKHIAVKEAMPYDVTLNELINGSEFLSMVAMSGSDRIITPSVTDKLWRRDLLAETLRLRFDGEWGTGEILNFHYFRHARSIAFTDQPLCNFSWTQPYAPCSYRRLEDLKKVYELKMLMAPDQVEGLRSELQSYLSDYIGNLIFRLGWTRPAALHYLMPVLADRFWHQVGIDTDLQSLIEESARVHKRNSLKNIFRELMG